MRRRHASLLAVCALASGLSGACGREGGGTMPLPPSAPPRWSVVRAETAKDTVLVDIKADAPCRVSLTVKGADGRAGDSAARVLAAGELARLWWRAEAFPAVKDGTAVSVDDAAAGRTEGWVAVLHYGWQDSGAARRVTMVGTRPGRGSARGPRNALPPPAPSVLDFGSEVELCAVAVVDGGTPELALVAGERGSRLQGPLDEVAGDRATVVRLVLRVERATP
jgi:hypothetical protein